MRKSIGLCFSSLGNRPKGVVSNVRHYHCVGWCNFVMSPYFVLSSRLRPKDFIEAERFFSARKSHHSFDQKLPYINYLPLGNSKNKKLALALAKSLGWQEMEKVSYIEVFQSPLKVKTHTGFRVSKDFYSNKKLRKDFTKTFRENFGSKPHFIRELHKANLRIKKRLQIVLIYSRNQKVAGAGLVATNNNCGYLFCGSVSKPFRGRGLWKTLVAARQEISMTQGARTWVTVTSNPRLIGRGQKSVRQIVFIKKDSFESWAQETIESARKKLLRKDGHKAIKIISKALKKEPANFHLQFANAQILGDVSYFQAGSKKRQMRAKAITILRRLLRKIKNQSPVDQWKVRRHLFHFTEQHLKNYRLGVREVIKGNKYGLLSQAFGAQGYAVQLLTERQAIKQAELWAQRSIEAWNALFKFDDRQVNRLGSYAIALTIHGEFKKSQTIIRQAAKAAKMPLSAFSDLNDLIVKIQKTREKLTSR